MSADMEFTITVGGAPLTIEGKIGEKTLFYRSRHGNWRIELDNAPIASGSDEDSKDSQDVDEALRLIGKHCYRPIWDVVMKRESAEFDKYNP